MIFVNDYDDGDLKVSDDCHISGKYRGSVRRDITVKLDHKVSVVFHNLKILISILSCKN